MNILDKQILLKKELIKRKIPSNLSLNERKLFIEDKFNKAPNFYLVKLKNVIINKNGLPVLKDKALIHDYLDLDSLRNLKFFKKIILLLKYKFNIILDRLDLSNKVKILNEAVFVNNRHSNGYFHWVSDTLPKIIYLEKNKFLNKKKILINLNYKSFQKEYCKKVNSNKFIFQKKNTKIFVKNFYYLSKIHNSGNPRKQSISLIRDFFLKKNKPKKKIYISRKFESKRNLMNEEEFCNYLKKKNFEIHYFERYSILKQINLISKTKILIGFSGSGLINCVWLSKKSSLIDIRPETDNYVNPFFSISNLIKFNYNFFLCKKTNFLKSNHYANFIIDIDRFDKNFKKILK